MIVKKVWLTKQRYHEWAREGWFLLGFIPLYVRDISPRKTKLRIK